MITTTYNYLRTFFVLVGDWITIHSLISGLILLFFLIAIAGEYNICIGCRFLTNFLIALTLVAYFFHPAFYVLALITLSFIIWWALIDILQNPYWHSNNYFPLMLFQVAVATLAELIRWGLIRLIGLIWCAFESLWTRRQKQKNKITSAGDSPS